jgi:hypothetical protein
VSEGGGAMAWRESTSISVDGFDDNDSEKDETKRKSRNLSEKKRRDQVAYRNLKVSTKVAHNFAKRNDTVFSFCTNLRKFFESDFIIIAEEEFLCLFVRLFVAIVYRNAQISWEYCCGSASR